MSNEPQNLEKKIDKLSTDLNLKEEITNYLYEENEQLTFKVQQLQKELSQKELEISGLRETNQEVNYQVKEREKVLKWKNAYIGELQINLQKLKQKFQQAKEENQDFSKYCQELESKLKSSSNDDQKSIKNLTKTTSLLISQNDKQNDYIRNSVSELKIIKQSFKQLNEQLYQKSCENEKMLKQFNNLKNEYDSLNSKNKEISDKNYKLQQQIDENNQLYPKRIIEVTDQQCKVINQQFKDLQSEYESFIEKISQEQGNQNGQDLIDVFFKKKFAQTNEIFSKIEILPKTTSSIMNNENLLNDDDNQTLKVYMKKYEDLFQKYISLEEQCSNMQKLSKDQINESVEEEQNISLQEFKNNFLVLQEYSQTVKNTEEESMIIKFLYRIICAQQLGNNNSQAKKLNKWKQLIEYIKSQQTQQNKSKKSEYEQKFQESTSVLNNENQNIENHPKVNLSQKYSTLKKEYERLKKKNSQECKISGQNQQVAFLQKDKFLSKRNSENILKGQEMFIEKLQKNFQQLKQNVLGIQAQNQNNLSDLNLQQCQDQIDNIIKFYGQLKQQKNTYVFKSNSKDRTIKNLKNTFTVLRDNLKNLQNQERQKKNEKIQQDFHQYKSQIDQIIELCDELKLQKDEYLMYCFAQDIFVSHLQNEFTIISQKLKRFQKQSNNNGLSNQQTFDKCHVLIANLSQLCNKFRQEKDFSVNYCNSQQVINFQLQNQFMTLKDNLNLIFNQRNQNDLQLEKCYKKSKNQINNIIEQFNKLRQQSVKPKSDKKETFLQKFQKKVQQLNSLKSSQEIPHSQINQFQKNTQLEQKFIQKQDEIYDLKSQLIDMQQQRNSYLSKCKDQEKVIEKFQKKVKKTNNEIKPNHSTQNNQITELNRKLIEQKIKLDDNEIVIQQLAFRNQSQKDKINNQTQHYNNQLRQLMDKQDNKYNEVEILIKSKQQNNLSQKCNKQMELVILTSSSQENENDKDQLLQYSRKNSSQIIHNQIYIEDNNISNYEKEKEFLIPQVQKPQKDKSDQFQANKPTDDQKQKSYQYKKQIQLPVTKIGFNTNITTINKTPQNIQRNNLNPSYNYKKEQQIKTNIVQQKTSIIQPKRLSKSIILPPTTKYITPLITCQTRFPIGNTYLQQYYQQSPRTHRTPYQSQNTTPRNFSLSAIRKPVTPIKQKQIQFGYQYPQKQRNTTRHARQFSTRNTRNSRNYKGSQMLLSKYLPTQPNTSFQQPSHKRQLSQSSNRQFNATSYIFPKPRGFQNSKSFCQSQILNKSKSQNFLNKHKFGKKVLFKKVMAKTRAFNHQKVQKDFIHQTQELEKIKNNLSGSLQKLRLMNKIVTTNKNQK